MDFELITFIDAIALVFIIEGIMPFMWPDTYKSFLARITQQDSNSLRVVGFASMAVGVVILYLVRYFFDF